VRKEVSKETKQEHNEANLVGIRDVPQDTEGGEARSQNDGSSGVAFEHRDDHQNSAKRNLTERQNSVSDTGTGEKEREEKEIILHFPSRWLGHASIYHILH
jgi:hypothetical protein